EPGRRGVGGPASLAAAARRGRRRGTLGLPDHRGAGHGSDPGRALRRRPTRRSGAAPTSRRARLLGPRGGPVARRHPHLLPDQRRPGDAARRDRPAAADLDAARAGAAGLRPAGRPPGQHAGRPEPGDAGDDPPHRPPGRRPGGGRDRAPDRQPDDRRGGRRGQPVRPDPPAAAGRHRLAGDHHRQPRQLPARTADGRTRAAGRLPARLPSRLPGRRGGPRPVGVDGGVGGVRRRLRGHPRLHPHREDLPRGLRHRGGGPDRAAGGPCRRAVRLPARRRHRHQPGPGLLPVAGQPARGDGAGPDLRPVRGRDRGADAAPGGSAARRRGRRRGAARALGLRRPGLRPRPRGRVGGPGGADLRLHPGPVSRPAVRGPEPRRHRALGRHHRSRTGHLDAL
ncbi:MAG: Mg-chelatase subunit ChlD, partial [uncultured Friedmanniella sp.]